MGFHVSFGECKSGTGAANTLALAESITRFLAAVSSVWGFRIKGFRALGFRV